MIAAHITEALRSAFPGVPFIFADPPGPVAALDGPCAELSPLQICDEGHEATIYLGEITHGHFGCYDESVSEEGRCRRIAMDVTGFVRDLLADRIVAASSFGGRMGGWRRLSPDEPVPGPGRLERRFVWSHPLQRPAK